MGSTCGRRLSLQSFQGVQNMSSGEILGVSSDASLGHFFIFSGFRSKASYAVSLFPLSQSVFTMCKARAPSGGSPPSTGHL